MSAVPAAAPPVVEELLARPGAFAFAQAVRIAACNLRAQGRDPGPDAFRFTVNPDLSFPPGDIASLRFNDRDGAGPVAELVLNLMGLHGAASPLPAYFTEYVAQHQDEPEALRDFFDIFHQRLIRLLYQSWRKYRYYARYRAGAADTLSGRFFGLIGLGHADLRRAKSLNWSRLMAYMGLIAFNGESAGSLESILRHYFSHEHIAIVPCIRRWISVPDDQRTRLGTANRRLGRDFILGEEMPDQTGKFRIRVTELSWERFNDFLPCGGYFEEMQTLVKFALRSRLDFDLELRLRPDAVRPWRLEAGNECRLGWSAWAGEGGDGIVVLETDHRAV